MSRFVPRPVDRSLDPGKHLPLESPHRARHLEQIRDILRRREMFDDAQRQLNGRTAGLRAAVELAIQDRDPLPDTAVLEAADWTDEDLAALRSALRE